MTHIAFIDPSLKQKVMASLRRPIYPPPEPSDFEDPDCMPTPWPHPPELDDDFWSVFEYISSETFLRFQNEDFTTPLDIDPKIAPKVIQLMKFLAPESTPGEDDFKPWGIWHQGAIRLIANVRWIAEIHGEIAEGLEFGTLALGDWTFHGLIKCMKDAKQHELTDVDATHAAAVDPDGKATQDTGPSP